MMGGPRRRGPAMPRMSLKGQGKLLLRVLKVIMQRYALPFAVVIACIIITALCTLQGTLFTKDLIDVYITGIQATNYDNWLAAQPEGSTEPLPAWLDPKRTEDTDEVELVDEAESTESTETPKVPYEGVERKTFSDLAGAIFRLAGILVVGIFCSWAQQRIMVNVSQGTMLSIRRDLFNHMESLPISYFDTHSHGDIMSIYTNDVDTLRQLIGQSLTSLVDSLVTVITTFCSMVMLSFPLTCLSLVLIAVTMVISGKLVGLSGKHFTAQQRNIGRVNGYIEEMMSGQKVVKVFCHEEKALEQFRALNEELRVSATEAHRWANTMGPINNNLGHISYVICAVVGAAIAIATGNTWMTLGTLITFLTLNRNFSRPVTQITQQMNSIVMAMAGAQRVFDLMDAPAEADDGYVELVNAKELPDGTLTESEHRTGLWAWKHPHTADGTVSYRKLTGGVVMDDVDFGYTPEKMVLHNITLYAMPGQKIAFVGGTGAGKTTITNLINRFYDIQDGKIRYDDININKIKKADLRRSLGMVLQDTHLFTGTVLDNIRYGRLDATDEECIQAAKLANADGFIRKLENGYNTLLTGDGANLSQGQRQLLAIARAAVADPPALILDEATSSIDTRTETLVQRGMDALMKGRTTFVIAHRLSTVKNSDCIMVLEQGRIIERGTHDDLIAQRGKYYQLYTGNAITGT